MDICFPLQIMVIDLFCNYYAWSIIWYYGHVLQLQDPKSKVVMLFLFLAMDYCMCDDAQAS